MRYLLTIIIVLLLTGCGSDSINVEEIAENETFAISAEDTEVAAITVVWDYADVAINSVTEMLFDADITYIGDLTFAENGTTDRMIRLTNDATEHEADELDNVSALGWNISLSPNIPIDLTIRGNIGVGNLDLSNLQLSALNVTSEVSELNITLPDTGTSYAVDIDGGIGVTTLTLPEGDELGITFTGGNTLGTLELPTRFVNAGSRTWHTENFEASNYQIVISFNGEIGELIVQ